jgi:2-polyprenyl-6-hydroxyphenyl methylase/3-demethylubiquinone-9 3-methyltransferase
MWDALDIVTACVAPAGALFIALYNDQGWKSRYWGTVKKVYVSRPILRWPLVLLHLIYPFGPAYAFRLLTGRPAAIRGMSFWRDVIDWVGGYPFEVATPAAVEAFLRGRGFALDTLVPTRRAGCNEFVFRRTSSSCAG